MDDQSGSCTPESCGHTSLLSATPRFLTGLVSSAAQIVGVSWHFLLLAIGIYIISSTFLWRLVSFTTIVSVSREGTSTTAEREKWRPKQDYRSRDLLTRVGRVVFSTTITLAAMQALWILIDLSRSEPTRVNIEFHERYATTKELVLRSLLFSIVFIVPNLDIYMILKALGWKYIDLVPRKLAGLRGRRLGHESHRSKRKGSDDSTTYPIHDTDGPYDVTTMSDKGGRGAWILHLSLFVTWLLSFYSAGNAVFGRLPTAHYASSFSGLPHTPTLVMIASDFALITLSVLGISLLALLSGFAALSAVYTILFLTTPTVSSAVLQRQQYGLEAAQSKLREQQNRLRALNASTSTALYGQSSPAATPTSATGGMFSKLSSTLSSASGLFRGGNDTERAKKALEEEISAYENMVNELARGLDRATAIRENQLFRKTAWGKMWRIFEIGFALWCAIRLGSVGFSSIMRHFGSFSALTPSTAAVTSTGGQAAAASPTTVDRLTSFFVGYLVPALSSSLKTVSSTAASTTASATSSLRLGEIDEASFRHLLSFSLSGVTLIASIGSVAQTLRLISRLTPRSLRNSNSSSRFRRLFLPVKIAQLAGIYVLSSSLLIRGGANRNATNSSTSSPMALGIGTQAMPDASDAQHSLAWVDGYFETWFLIGATITFAALWLTRRLGIASTDGQYDEFDLAGDSTYLERKDGGESGLGFVD